jgi:hypothetical protein
MSWRRLRAFIAFVLPFAALLVFRGQAQTQTENPHGDLKLSCGDCHSPERWKPVDNPPEFRHQQVGFTLDGSHSGISCRGCHRSLVFSQVGTSCADCHKDPHRGELGFRCEACHTSRTWTNRNEMFQRHSKTLFPLLANHANVDCDSCHRGQQPNQYVTTPTDCGSCHVQSYVNARNPNHVLAGFSRRCEDCHIPTAATWHQTTFRHPDTYPLLGAHARAACGDCHKTTFQGTPRDCVACHRADYAATRNPNHAASGFPTTCNSCHGMEGWQPARFVDHSRTRFPLTGAHQQADCAQCHVNGRFAGTPTDCYSCHQQNYQGTTNPNHVAGNFPTTCQACHSTTAWQPASSIDHNRTRFPLTGAHGGTPCASCHVGGRYAGTPTDCFSCHQSNYNSTSNPNHRAANFPTQCQNCHSTSAWRPANFDHDGAFFPIYSGRHRGAWSSCQDCHVNSGNYAVFECINCHAHSRSEMDGKHREVRSYSYQSTACYRCHPRGSGGD